MADPLVAAAHDRSTVFAMWYRCARPPNTRFLETTPLTIPNGTAIELVVFPQRARYQYQRTDRHTRENDDL